VAESGELTLSRIAHRCDRKVSELQRMVQVLRNRGYIERTASGGYRPGLKLYELGRYRHPFRQLQSVAEPIIARLAEETGFSIHLSVEDRGQMLILSEVLGSGIASVALKVGSRHPLESTLSGRILMVDRGASRQRAADRRKIEREGFLSLPSPLFSGVMDFGVPIRRHRGGTVIAVLASSWLKSRKGGEATEPKLFEKLSEAAAGISAAL